MVPAPNDPLLLRARAGEARILAANTSDPNLSAQMLEIVAIYEELAYQAERKKRRPRRASDLTAQRDRCAAARQVG